MIVRSGGLCRLLVATLFAAAVALRLWDPGVVQAIRFAVLGRIDAWLPPVPVRPTWAITAEIAAVVLAMALIGWLAPRLKPPRIAILGALAGAVILAAVAVAALRFGLLFDPTWPLASTIVIAGGAALFVRSSAERKRDLVRSAFGHSLPRPVTDLIAERPDLVTFAGTLRELTVMSVTIRYFAAIVSPMKPAELAVFLRQIHDRLAGIILERNGMLDTQSGDGLLAFFNAPLDDPSHAGHAAEAAARIGAAFDALNAGRRTEAGAAGRRFIRVHFDVGIDTGDCTTGNLVSERHAAWSAVGPSIAIAARIGALCKEYGVGVVIGERTVALMSGPALELDLVRVTGGGKPHRVFTLLDPLVGDASLRPRLAAAHARMIAAYRNADWTEAETALRECRSFRIEALATLHSLYRTRIVTAREIAPPSGWEGTDTATLDERGPVTEVTPGAPMPRHSGRRGTRGREGGEFD